MYPLDNFKALKRGYLFGQPTFYNNFHIGLDLIVPTGIPIFAPFDCNVTNSVGSDAGNTVTATFNGIVMRCLHLSKFGVKGNVKQGDTIGWSGNTGLSTGPHVHLDLSKNKLDLNNPSNFIDPDKFNWQGEEDMTNEEVKLLIYKATTGHEPQGDERTFALGPITPGDLANLRFRDDVIGSIWRGGLNSNAPDSEKEFWSTYFREHVDKHISVLGDQWRTDHVDSQIQALNTQIASLKTQLTAANAKVKALTADKTALTTELTLARDTITKLTTQLQNAQAAYKEKLLAKAKAFLESI